MGEKEWESERKSGRVRERVGEREREEVEGERQRHRGRKSGRVRDKEWERKRE